MISVIDSKAAVLTKPGGDWEIHDIGVESPQVGEVLVKLAFAGLCYSDEHLRFGPGAELPIVGGHEGSGVVQAVGPGVTKVKPGDHVALTFVSICGHCYWCARGQWSLCESGGRAGVGRMPDRTFRFRGGPPSLP